MMDKGTSTPQRFILRDRDGIDWEAILHGKVANDLVFFLEDAGVFLWVDELRLEEMFDEGTATHMEEETVA